MGTALSGGVRDHHYRVECFMRPALFVLEWPALGQKENDSPPLWPRIPKVAKISSAGLRQYRRDIVAEQLF